MVKKSIMNLTTNKILKFMNIMAWLIFIGLAIETGTVLLSFTISFINPIVAKNLYMGLNFYELMQYNIWQYVLAVCFIVALLLMKAFVAYLVIKTLSKVNIERPFTTDVVKKMEIVSYLLFGIWLVCIMFTFHSMTYRLAPVIEKQTVSGEFLLFAALIYVFSQIFKRGIELQNESDFTV